MTADVDARLPAGQAVPWRESCAEIRIRDSNWRTQLFVTEASSAFADNDNCGRGISVLGRR